MNQFRMTRPKILGQLWANWTPFMSFPGLELAQAIHAETRRQERKMQELAERLLDVTDK